MQTAQEFLNDKQKSSFLIAGDFGEGKTTVGLSFPKFFYIGLARRVGGNSQTGEYKIPEESDCL